MPPPTGSSKLDTRRSFQLAENASPLLFHWASALPPGECVLENNLNGPLKHEKQAEILLDP